MHHVVLTLAAALRPLWLANRKRVTAIYFEAISSALLELMADPRYCGGLAGMIGIFHSGGQGLLLHPHWHFAVYAAGYDRESEEWKHCRPNWLIPKDVLGALVRGRVLSALTAAYKAGRLYLPNGMEAGAFFTLLGRLQRQAWNTYVGRRGDGAVNDDAPPAAVGGCTLGDDAQPAEPTASAPAASDIEEAEAPAAPTAADPSPLIKYFASNLYGGPVRDFQIISTQGGRVRFHAERSPRRLAAKLRRGGTPVVLEMTQAQFVEQRAQHNLPKHTTRVRYYGFLSPRQTALFEVARQRLMGDEGLTAPAAADEDHERRCPSCAAPLRRRRSGPCKGIVWRRPCVRPGVTQSATQSRAPPRPQLAA
jgi:hypothetical protein